jgi:hypothetical protein
LRQKTEECTDSVRFGAIYRPKQPETDRYEFTEQLLCLAWLMALGASPASALQELLIGSNEV